MTTLSKRKNEQKIQQVSIPTNLVNLIAIPSSTLEERIQSLKQLDAMIAYEIENIKKYGFIKKTWHRFLPSTIIGGTALGALLAFGPSTATVTTTLVAFALMPISYCAYMLYKRKHPTYEPNSEEAQRIIYDLHAERIKIHDEIQMINDLINPKTKEKAQTKEQFKK